MAHVLSRSKAELLVLFILLLALPLVGCAAATPTTRWAQARESLTETEKQLTLNARLGNLTVEEIRLADVGVKAARTTLTDAEKLLPGGGVTFDNNLAVVRAIVRRLAEHYAAGLPTTQRSQ